MSRAPLTRALELFTHSRLWVAAMITCLSAFAAMSLRLPLEPLPLALVFFCALGIYNLDHVVDLPREQAKSARVLVWVALGAVVLLLTQSSPEVAVLIVLGTCLSSAYFVPVRVGRKRVRIETIPVMKPLIIGSAVATAATFVPLLDAVTRATSGAASPGVDALLPYLPEALFRTGVIALLCGANSLVFDLRDVAVDREKGVATAPIARGSRFTRLLVSTMLVLAVFAAELGYAFGITAVLDVRRALQVAALSILFCTWTLPARAARPVWALSVDGTLAVPLLWLLLAERLGA
jgi:4-hydroxybenzoate polyprenyltransferase